MTPHARRFRPVLIITGAALAVAMLLTGCSRGTSAPDQSGPAPARAAGEPRDSAATQEKASVPQGVPLKAPGARDIVYTGELTVRVDDVADAAGRASRIATTAGGFVGGDERHIQRGNATATLVLRVPAAAFYDTVTRVADLGQETSRQVGTADVTEQVVDLDARIASQRASVNRTRALLNRAQQISDIVAIEKELSSREAELGALEGRKRTLADQVTLSTVTVRMVGPEAVTSTKEPDRGFVAGLAAGWTAFLATVTVLLTALGAVLPFLLAVAIPALVIWLVVRRRIRKSANPTARPAVVDGAASVPEGAR